MVEDDAAVRDAIGLLLGLHGYPIALFADAESFLAAYQAGWRGCLLLDIRMPGMDGLTLQKRLLEVGCAMPAIVMTGHGTVESARDAFRHKAVDFLEKPVDYQKLLNAIQEAISLQVESQASSDKSAEYLRLLTTLTAREREVMELVVGGRHNREIAEMLGISARTVEVHKARMMAKLGAAGVPDLVRLSLGAK
jgi:FixJ family two-component response regulator